MAYPFQNNIAALDLDDQLKCISGLIEAKVMSATAQGRPKDFDEWIIRFLASLLFLFHLLFALVIWGFAHDLTS